MYVNVFRYSQLPNNITYPRFTVSMNSGMVHGSLKLLGMVVTGTCVAFVTTVIVVRELGAWYKRSEERLDSAHEVCEMDRDSV